MMDILKPEVRAAGMQPVSVEYALMDYPQAFADAEAPPARSTIVVAALPRREAVVEIDAIALAGDETEVY